MKFFWLTIIFYSANVLSNSPSFNCNSNSLTLIEKELCSNSELAFYDVQLNHLYSKLKKNLIVKKDQRNWLKNRNAMCSSQSKLDRISCLKIMYKQRISELNYLISS